MKLSTVFLILACLVLSLVIASSGRRGRKIGRMKNSSGDKSGSRDKSSSGSKSYSGGKSRSGCKGKWTTAPTTKLTTVLTSAPTTAPTTEQTTVSTSAPTTSPTTAPTTEQTTVLTSAPTTKPTTAPTAEQTTVLTSAPTTPPTMAPTTEQTTVSASAPTTPPTTEQTNVSASAPTTSPTRGLTTEQTTVSTSAPTTTPTTTPTRAPTTEQTTVITSAPTTTPTRPPTTEETTVTTSASTAPPTRPPTTEQRTVITSAPTTTPTRPPTTEETTVPVTSPTTTDHTVCTAPSASSEGGLPLPRDCWDLRCLYNVSKDGVYQVYPTDGVNISVLCDMATDGGGWTIFQQRDDGSANFSRKYGDYKNGFGDLKTEFWMGNDFLHQFTTIKNQTLRFDFCKKNNSATYAIYDSFAIGSGADCYRLHVAVYHGTADDSLIGIDINDPKHNGQCFSAYDKDEDQSDFNMALSYESGWWFKGSSSALLNAPYSYFGGETLLWSEKEWVKSSQMKFRPSYARHLDATGETFKCPVNH